MEKNNAAKRKFPEQKKSSVCFLPLAESKMVRCGCFIDGVMGWIAKREFAQQVRARKLRLQKQRDDGTT